MARGTNGVAQTPHAWEPCRPAREPHSTAPVLTASPTTDCEVLGSGGLIAKLRNRSAGGWVPPVDVPHSLSDERAASVTGRPRIVLNSTPATHKVPQLLDAWADWGFRPSRVVFEHAKTASPMQRVRDKVKRHGLGGVRRLCRTSVRVTRSYRDRLLTPYA